MLPQLLDVLLLRIDSVQDLLSLVFRTRTALVRALASPSVLAARWTARPLVLVVRSVIVLPIWDLEL